MNDEFVSHNNSNGGWDGLNKWVSMLTKKRCMFDPLKDRKRGCSGSNCKLYCVICRLKFAEFHQYLKMSFFHFWKRRIPLNIIQHVLLLEVHLFSFCQHVLVCKKCGKSSRFSLECKGQS